MILLGCWELKGNQTENRKLTTLVPVCCKKRLRYRKGVMEDMNSKIKSNSTYIVVFDFISDEK